MPIQQRHGTQSKQNMCHASACNGIYCQLINKDQAWWGMGSHVTNRFFQSLSIALATTSSLHALSIIITTFSLSSISCHPSTLSRIHLSVLSLSSTTYVHLITKWSMSSTSPFPHSVHALFFLLKPYHLVASIPNSAVPWSSQHGHPPPLPLTIYPSTLSLAFKVH